MPLRLRTSAMNGTSWAGLMVGLGVALAVLLAVYRSAYQESLFAPQSVVSRSAP